MRLSRSIMSDNVDFSSKKFRELAKTPAVYGVYLTNGELLCVDETDDLHRELYDHWYNSRTDTVRGRIKDDDDINIPIESVRTKTVYKREIESSEVERKRLKQALNRKLNPRYNMSTDQEDISAVDTEIPPVPQIKNDITPPYKKDYYQMLNEDNRLSPDNLPATVRKIIFEHQELSEKKFNEFIKEKNYTPTPDSGATKASLTVLDEVTNEIEQKDEAGITKIIWTGN